MGKNEYSSRDVRRFRWNDNKFFDAYIREKQKRENYVPREAFSDALYKEGIEWFLSEKTLEEAPEEKLSRLSFIQGYTSESVRHEAELYMYNLGFNCYFLGGTIESLPPLYRTKEATLRGYADAQKYEKELTNTSKKRS